MGRASWLAVDSGDMEIGATNGTEIRGECGVAGAGEGESGRAEEGAEFMGDME